MKHLGTLALAATTFLLGCNKGSNAPPEPAPTKPAPAQAASSSPPTPSTPATAALAPVKDALTRVPAPARLVAIGDLHGDFEAARATLRLGGAIDDKDHWSGGALVVVQTGDMLDRGDGERAILDLFERLGGEAKAAGGAVIALNGNHEVMNVQLDFRYVTENGFRDFAGVPGASLLDPHLANVPEPARARAAALAPGAPYAKRLAQRDTIVLVGDTIFVHGGVLPKHIKYGLARINREISAWMSGDNPAPPAIAVAEDDPIWTRRYSAAPDAEDCKVLGEALSAVSAKRMVVGHTVQRGGITAACDDRVWRIDVGLSHYYGGEPEVLEITGDTVKKLRKKAP